MRMGAAAPSQTPKQAHLWGVVNHEGCGKIAAHRGQVLHHQAPAVVERGWDWQAVVAIKPVGKQAPARVQHIQYWRGIVLRGAQHNADDGHLQLYTVQWCGPATGGGVPSIQLQQHWEQHKHKQKHMTQAAGFLRRLDDFSNVKAMTCVRWPASN